MMAPWRERSAATLSRNMLRDFCVVHGIVMEQAARFAHSQTISYAVLRELLGEAVSKGVFWRLKDTAHHLFRKSDDGKRSFEGYGMTEEFSAFQEQDATEKLLESMVDWCIGYAFHECCKLREDAFQLQHYSNRLLQLQKRSAGQETVIAQLMPFTAQTKQSIAREMERILGVLNEARTLFLTYFTQQGNNALVAWYLCSEESLAEQCFGEQYPDLLKALYGDDAAKPYVLAATACLEGGHRDEAMSCVAKAEALGAHKSLLAPLLEIIHSHKPQVPTVL